MTELEYSFYLEMAHKTPGFPADHPNSRMHGHSYLCTLYLKGLVNEQSAQLVEYSELKEKVQEVVNKYDHHCMNDFEGLENPSSELLAKTLYKEFQEFFGSKVEKVKVGRPSIHFFASYFEE